MLQMYKRILIYPPIRLNNINDCIFFKVFIALYINNYTKIGYRKRKQKDFNKQDTKIFNEEISVFIPTKKKKYTIYALHYKPIIVHDLLEKP